MNVHQFRRGVRGRDRTSAAGSTAAGTVGPSVAGIGGGRADGSLSQVPDDVGLQNPVDTVLSMDPLVLTGLVAVLLAILVVALYLHRRRRTPGKRFRSALSDPESVSVLMHPNPDPDAMAAAIAVAHLSEHLGTAATIQYPGQIQHQENRAFEAVLDLDFERIESSAEVTGEEVVLVDHNEPRGFSGAESIDPYAVVDHHPGVGKGTAFTDVRTNYGACATILATYFEELDATVVDPKEGDPSDELTVPSEVATGLMYGIQSDTNRLTSGVSPAEFRACQYLYRGIDDEIIDRVANPKVESEVLDVKARAIRNRKVQPPYAISNVGPIDNVDAIPQSADELIRLEGVSTVVVYGRRDDTVHISARSRDDRIHVGKALKAAVDGIPMASAGGHSRMGGGQLSIQHMEGIGPATGIGIEEFEQRVLDALRGER